MPLINIINAIDGKRKTRSKVAGAGLKGVMIVQGTPFLINFNANVGTDFNIA